MSAPLRPEALPPDELDLLLSRRVDGDLSPAESEELDAFLAASPEGRARLEALSSVVACLRQAPVPAASFALSTRVFSRVLEGSGAVSGLFHRFGIAPKMGYLFALMAGVCIVAVGLLSKTRPVATVAEVSASAPSRDVVSVFIPSSPAPARTLATGTGSAEAPAAAKAEAKAAGSAPASAPVLASASASVPASPASPVSPASPAAVVADASAGRMDAAKAMKREEAESPRLGSAEQAAFAPEPPVERRAGAPAAVASLAAPSAPAPPSLLSASAQSAPAVSSVPPVSSVSLAAVGGGPSPWKLAEARGLASLRGPLSAWYRLTVSADGRVTALRKLSASPDPLPASVEPLLRDLRLERIPGVADAPEVEVRLNVP